MCFGARLPDAHTVRLQQTLLAARPLQGAPLLSHTLPALASVLRAAIVDNLIVASTDDFDVRARDQHATPRRDGVSAE